MYAVDANATQRIFRDDVQVLDASKFYQKDEKVPPVDAPADKRKKAVFGFFQKPLGYANPKNPKGRRAFFYRPVGIALDYQNIDYFKNALPPDANVNIEYLIWLTSAGALNGRNVSVFAFTTEIK